MKKLGLATALLVAVTGAQAYQFEVQGQSEYIDTAANNKDFTGGVQGTYYLKDVDTSKGPLAEAAFLNQASSVSAAYNYAEYKYDKEVPKAKIHSYGVKAEGFVATPVVPVYASATYSHTETKRSGSDDSGDRYALEVGAVVVPGFLVAAGYTNVPNHSALDTFGIMKNGIASSLIEADDVLYPKSDAATLRAKYVGPISGTNMAFGFETAATIGENTLYGLNADLYLNPKLSIGATFLGSDMSVSDNADVANGINGYAFNQAYGANVNYFITPAVAVGVSYLHANYKGDIDGDMDTVGVNAKFRF